MNAARPSRRGTRVRGAALAVAVAGLALTGCTEVESSAVEGYEPSQLEEVKGSDIMRVEFTGEGAKRTGLKTGRVERSGSETVVPYAALIYDPAGKTYVYASPEPLAFMRTEVKVDRIEGKWAYLKDGPPRGTEVVTTGAAEVYGAELDIAGSH